MNEELDILSKEQINSRFLYAVGELLSKRIVRNKVALATVFGITSAKFTEILSGRMKAGVDMLAVLCAQYRISPDWLLMNKGDMIINQEQDKSQINGTGVDNESALITHFIHLIEEKDSKIICQAEEIGKLKERILQYERQKNTP